METRTGFLISQIKQVQGRVFERLLAESGVAEFNGPQGHILYVLWQGDGMPIVELSRKTGLAKNTLTAMLARMEESGLLRREPDAQDRRVTRICLTDKARALDRKYQAVSQQMNELYFPDFSAEEAALLDSLLDRVLENLEAAEQDLKKERK